MPLSPLLPLMPPRHRRCSSVESNGGELSSIFFMIFFAAGFFFLPGSCLGGGFAFGTRERSLSDRRLSIVDLAVSENTSIDYGELSVTLL